LLFAVGCWRWLNQILDGNQLLTDALEYAYRVLLDVRL
jgi:hypothetical protein